MWHQTWQWHLHVCLRSLWRKSHGTWPPWDTRAPFVEWEPRNWRLKRPNRKMKGKVNGKKIKKKIPFDVKVRISILSESSMCQVLVYLSNVVYRIIGHGLQKTNRFLKINKINISYIHCWLGHFCHINLWVLIKINWKRGGGGANLFNRQAEILTFFDNVSFSHDVTAAILVYKTMERRPCWWTK